MDVPDRMNEPLRKRRTAPIRTGLGFVELLGRVGDAGGDAAWVLNEDDCGRRIEVEAVKDALACGWVCIQDDRGLRSYTFDPTGVYFLTLLGVAARRWNGEAQVFRGGRATS